jgi:exopolyphosphatase/guanosine-5'-triphosphate,3'-diphosphate pyrophosphatase
LRDESSAAIGLRALSKHVRLTLGPLAKQLVEYRFDIVVATSGTVLGLAALDAAESGLSTQRAHGYVLKLERLRALQKTMMAMTPAERRKMPGMNPRRSDIIVAGNAIVIGILEALGRDELVVSERALRDGIVIDYLERNIAVARKLGDERTRRFDSAHALARRFGAPESHQNNVASLALGLFDGLAELHGFEPADRDALFAAALVHDVGRAIAVSGHHKHGAYIVANAELAGWRDEEIDLIAALVRYHRKSLPKPTHPEWAAASAALRDKIGKLAAILRLADGLDRRRLGVVSGVDVRVTAGSVLLRLDALQDISAEIDGATFKSDFFVKFFGRAIAFEAVRRESYGPTYDENEPGADQVNEAILAP